MLDAKVTLAHILNALYPIGSIYMNVLDVDPSEIIGGTWERIQNRFLLAAGSAHANGTTGGAETVTLTEDQMPSHTHNITYAQYQRGTGSATATALQYTGSTKTTEKTGGGKAHNNMPPYLVVNVWKRIA